MHIELGNASVIDSRPDPTQPIEDQEAFMVGGEAIEDTRFLRPDIGESVTIVEVPSDTSLSEMLTTVAALWQFHSNQPPVWVASDNPAAAMILAEQFHCPVKEL